MIRAGTGFCAGRRARAGIRVRTASRPRLRGPSETAQFPGEFGETLAHSGGPVTTCEVVLDLLGDPLHLLAGVVLGLPGLAARLLGVLAGAARLVLRPARLLLPLLLGALEVLLGLAPALLVGPVPVEEIGGVRESGNGFPEPEPEPEPEPLSGPASAVRPPSAAPADVLRASFAAWRISRRRSFAEPLTSARISAASSETDSRISISRSASSPLRPASSARPASVIEYTFRPPSEAWVTSPSASSLARRGYTVPALGAYSPWKRSSRSLITS